MKRSRVKPFSFKATFIDSGGKKVEKSFNLTSAKRRRDDTTYQSESVRHEEEISASSSDFIAFVDDTEATGQGLSNHEKRQLSLHQKWCDLRGSILHSFVKECRLPTDQLCVACEENAAVSRCENCGPRQYLCLVCARALHYNRNQFHVLEQWKVRELCRTT